jgi:hypothetical protein
MQFLELGGMLPREADRDWMAEFIVVTEADSFMRVELRCIWRSNGASKGTARRRRAASISPIEAVEDFKEFR